MASARARIIHRCVCARHGDHDERTREKRDGARASAVGARAAMMFAPVRADAGYAALHRLTRAHGGHDMRGGVERARAVRVRARAGVAGVAASRRGVNMAAARGSPSTEIRSDGH